MRKLAVGAVVVILLLMTGPAVIQLAGSAFLSAVASATSTLATVSPALMVLSFGVAGVAIVFGGILAAFGHGHGHKMIRGAVLLAVIGAASGSALTYLHAQGPALAAQLTSAGGTMFQQAVQRLP